MSDPHAYTVGWICALPTELAAARTFLDEQHPAPKAVQRNDCNIYTLGTIGKHNVVIAVMPKREYGIAAAATVANNLVHSFPNVRIGLMVGVGGGAPSQQNDIRLGDIVVGSRDAGKGGVVQYDYGKMMQNQGFVETGSLNQPPPALLNAVAGLETEYMMQGPELDSKVQKALIPWKRLQKTHSRPDASTDRLYKSDFIHPLNSDATCSQACDANTANVVSRDKRSEDEDNPAIHYGLIASANRVMKNAEIRDQLSAEKGVLCFEMEAAGLMNHFPCLVIRGICDYSDSHKNKAWQGFAAMVAAAYAKDLLLQIPLNSVEAEKPVREVLNTIQEGLHGLKQTADETKMAVETMHSDHTCEQILSCPIEPQPDFFRILLFGLQQGVQDLKLGKAEDLSIARNPHFVVPFPSDPDFVNRPDIWAWTETRYAESERRFALVGLGGFGKSQVAIQFAHQVRVTSPNTSIFWVNASTKATFEDSYRSIAEVLALPRRHDPGVNVLALLRDWLQKEDVSPWLMIVDNADDIEMLFSKINSQTDASIPIASYIPKTDHGKILVTSRSWDAAEKLTGNGKMIFRVPTMEEAQALQLLQKKLDQDVDEDDALRLVHTLGHIPLAVNQAAAYIHKRSRVTIRSYLDELQKSEKRKGTLLRSDRGDIRRYDGVSNSVVLTWQLTFEQIKREQPRAANLLSLMSYFHAQNIPEYMLHSYSSGSVSGEESDNDDDDDNDNGDLEDDLDVLQSYSLITMTATSGFCVFETWEKCQALMPHVEQLLNEEPAEESDRLEWSELVTNMSHYFLMLGDYYRAEATVLQAVRIRTGSLGQKHPSTLTSMANLASTYRHQGRWEEAEKLEVQVMETSKTKLRADHPSTLMSMANLASTYRNQGRWEEAEKLDVQAMETSKTKLGADHPDTLMSMANLASTYRHQGRWEEAEKLDVQVMETRKTKLGADHPDTLTSMSNLASTFWHQGRWEEAENLFVQVMETSKTKLGADHPDTLTSMANLAVTYMNQGRWEEAEKLDDQVMETRKTKLGADHPDTLMSMANLATTFWNQGRWEEAEKLEVQVMETRKTKLGADHPDTLMSMGNLASTYRNQGRWEEAEKLDVQVMETSKTKLRADHPSTLMSMANLAVTYMNQGRWEEAEKLLVQVMETRKTKLGADHPDTLTSMANLASTYRNQGRWEEAEKLDVQVMETSKTKLRADHPSTLMSMANLASTYRNQGRWEEAEKLDVQVMETSKTKLGADHPDTLTSMANLAHTWKSQGRRVDAIQLMRDCLGLRQRRLGVNHPDTRSSFSILDEWEKIPVAKKRIVFKVPKRKKRMSFKRDLYRR
ncbi:hypothetical protein QIS74_13623 [Colletotrichum tabaci]|uniref:Kinesin light chain n=1 Tax=Colletotrichum tabaci TaxID=1209068 RepID=A0AAV9ST91_9PEZI